MTFTPNSNTYPWDAVVFVNVTFSDGFVLHGSGAMVGPNDILTASHIVYRRGTTVTDIDVFPAYNGTPSQVFGSFTTGEWRTNSTTLITRARRPMILR